MQSERASILKTMSSEQHLAQLSSKLLQGYTMLEETCPLGGNVPLVRARGGDKRMYCVHCESFFTLDTDKRKLIPVVDKKADNNVAKSNTVASADVDIASEKNAMARAGSSKYGNDPSKAMAQLLLEGWTMLDKISPVDGCTPLMRSPQGKVMCVVSGLQVVEDLSTNYKENSGDFPSSAEAGGGSVGEERDKRSERKEAQEEYSGIMVQSCRSSLEQTLSTAAKSLSRLCESERVQPADLVAWLDTMDKSLKLMKELKSYNP